MAQNTANHTLYIEYMPLDDLITRLHPLNPKEHDFGLIISMIDTFGYVTSGVIDEVSGKFAEGNGRTEGLHKMFTARKDKTDNVPDNIHLREDDNMWLVPVQRGARFETERSLVKFLAGSNQATIRGGWNDAMLYEALTFAFEDDDAEIIGFDDETYQSLASALFGDDLDFDEGNAVDESPNHSDTDWLPPENNISLVQLYYDPEQSAQLSGYLRVIREYADAPNPSIAILRGLQMACDTIFESDPELRGMLDEND